MELFAFILLIVWGLLALGVAVLAGSRGQSAVGFFLLSLFFSPVLGLIVVLLMKNLNDEFEEAGKRRVEERREFDRQREHEKQLESQRVLAASLATQVRSQTVEPQVTRSIADELTNLAALRDRGVLSSEEFEQQKKQLLGRSPT
jgi:hypothetical protein